MINTRYEIIRELGEGRSSVYLCHDIEFPGKIYAIKILKPGVNDSEQNSFIKEYFILKKLEHPCIIRPFGLGTVVSKNNEDNIEIGSRYITLEFFDGDELLKSKEIYNEKNLKEIAKQLCSVLYYLHQSKYIYYDLKPENILVSFKGNNPEIRLIDMGLCECSPSCSDYEIKGTAHYIAPELLKKENHNHSVDFYSLGIILYRIVYDRFPFDYQNELDIYKASIESDFDFNSPEGYSLELVNIIKKLLSRDLAVRYSSALHIIKDLGFEFDTSLTRNFLPAKVFSSRDYAVNVLSRYISDKSSSEVFTVKGFDGVGKTSLINQIMEKYTHSILISDVKSKSGAELIKYILRKIIFSESVFPILSEEDRALAINLINKKSEEILNDLRSIMILLSAKSNFILLLDDFNLFDQLSIDLLLEIIPILQVNNIKMIISESSEHDFISSKINNVREITLGSFTDEETARFLHESYSDILPYKELQNLIIFYADLVPGNIKSFIKDIILLGIMKFSEEGISISDEEDKLSVLKKAHFAIYDLRLANLSEVELYLVKCVSAIDTFIDSSLLSEIVQLSLKETEEIITKLQFNNVFQKYTSGQTIIFTSEAFKKHVYNFVENKKELHLQIAKGLTKKANFFNRLEEARQYELAGEYEICFNILMNEVIESEKHSAFAYIKDILEHIIQIPLADNLKNRARIKLTEIYYKLGDVNSALTSIKKLKSLLPATELGLKFFTIEGSALITSGEYEPGKKVITELLERIEDIQEKQRLMVELAYADFELKKYEEAVQQCDVLLNDNNLSPELKGRCYNLKGMIEVYQNNKLDISLENFQLAKKEFIKAKEPIRVSGTEVNIGNIYTLLFDYDKAELHWKNASQINQSIGNLEQEGVLLQNFGLFYFFRQKYDAAIQAYLKAQNIFLSLGNENSCGLILINLGEVYLKTCDYQNSLNSLIEAYKIFNRMKNFEETCEALTLLGKLYYTIGSVPKLKETINLLESILHKAELPSKYFINLRYLRLSLNLLKDDKVSLNDFNRIVDEYKNIAERRLLIETRFLLIKCLIDEENFLDAYRQLMDREILELSSQNSLVAAEREYFLGVISRNYESDKLLPPLVHFEKAYDLIKEESIVELTWKVLFAISDLYLERGNLNKAKQYIVYTRELIYFIAERIDSPWLRAAYLKQVERMNALKKLENFYPA